MQVKKLKLKDCYCFNLKNFRDKRGSFNEIVHQEKYKKFFKKKLIQTNFSCSKKNTFRGIHLQIKKSQGKLLTVISGRIKDIVIDLRKNSPTFGKAESIILSEKKNQQIWIPAGFGHGFLALTNNVKLIYHCDNFYFPQYEKVLSYNDKIFKKIIKIKKNFIVSPKDKKGLTLKDINKLI